MIWMMGQRGLSGSWMTQKKEEWLMHQRVLLLSRGTSTGWRNGLMGTCAVQWGKFTGGGTSPCPRMHWGLPSWEAVWPAEKDLGILVDTRLHMSEQGCPCCRESKHYPGLCEGILPLCSAQWPVLGSPVWETQTYWRRFSKDPQSREGARAPLQWGKSETMETVQPGEE